MAGRRDAAHSSPAAACNSTPAGPSVAAASLAVLAVLVVLAACLSIGRSSQAALMNTRLVPIRAGGGSAGDSGGQEEVDNVYLMLDNQLRPVEPDATCEPSMQIFREHKQVRPAASCQRTWRALWSWAS